MKTETETKVAVVKENEVLDIAGLEINQDSPAVLKRLRELKATQNILKSAGVQVNNAFYGYALSEHKKVLIARATSDYQ